MNTKTKSLVVEDIGTAYLWHIKNNEIKLVNTFDREHAVAVYELQSRRYKKSYYRSIVAVKCIAPSVTYFELRKFNISTMRYETVIYATTLEYFISEVYKKYKLKPHSLEDGDVLKTDEVVFITQKIKL